MSTLPPTSSLPFPPGFLWGAATSPTQVEGHIENEWTPFVAQDGSRCNVACDSYHRYPEDVEWIAKLGLNAYRFGIEWSRLQAAPFARLNPAALARYVDQLDQLRAAGITPMVVLHHFSNPPWLNAAGGWTNAAAIPAFVDYVRQLVAALKERVYIWNTFNEPDTYACVASARGVPAAAQMAARPVPPGDCAHGPRPCPGEPHPPARRRGRPPQVGIAKNWTFFHAYQRFSPWDRATAYACHYTFNKFVLDAFLGGWRRRASTFIGLNYYGRVRFHHFRAMIPASGAPVQELKQFGFVCDDMVERYPEGMAKILAYLHRKFRLPIYITEHGSASADEQFRARDLRQNLAALHRSIQAGADVRGFFYWSLDG